MLFLQLSGQPTTGKIKETTRVKKHVGTSAKDSGVFHDLIDLRQSWEEIRRGLVAPNFLGF